MTTPAGRAIINAASIWSRLAKDPVYGDAVIRGKDSRGQQECDLLRCQTEGSVQGTGVFAKQQIADGEVILMGVGKYVLKETQSSEQMPYSFDICPEGQWRSRYGSVALDFSDVRSSNLLRYVNAASGKTAPNTVLLWKGPVPFLTACTVIQQGEELFLRYSF